MSEYYHIPVMVPEALDALQVRRDGLYMDCTLGGAGIHWPSSTGGAVVAIDRDPEAIAWSVKRLSSYGVRFSANLARFSGIREIAGSRAGCFDGVLMDLGIVPV